MKDYWTPEEEMRLLKLREAGVAVDDLAARFGRSRRAVNHKLQQLRSAK